MILTIKVLSPIAYIERDIYIFKHTNSLLMLTHQTLEISSSPQTLGEHIRRTCTSAKFWPGESLPTQEELYTYVLGKLEGKVGGGVGVRFGSMMRGGWRQHVRGLEGRIRRGKVELPNIPWMEGLPPLTWSISVSFVYWQEEEEAGPDVGGEAWRKVLLFFFW